LQSMPFACCCFHLVQCPYHASISLQQYTDLVYLGGSLDLAIFVSTGQ